jgi:phosphopantothenoylcysteine decarboxylase/phosphopantothenate--cysteine ligase
MEILLGVTGCIGAYKSAELVRRLRRSGAGVRVVLTRSAGWFVTEGTLQTLTGRPVYTDLFRPRATEGIEHIDLARSSDLLLVAPATANVIGKFAGGIADDLLSTLHLAFEGPVIIAPAMNSSMYRHPSVQENMRKLVARGVDFVGPGEGELACGETGEGRLLEPEAIVAAVLQRLSVPEPTVSLQGRRVLVTSGPTREPIDPVRFLTNPSTGRMGHALATAARRRGATVWLVSGPTTLADPAGVKVIPVTTALEMEREVLARAESSDLVLMAAAVADYRPTHAAPAKIKKSGEPLSLRLEPVRDILAELGRRPRADGRPVLVGFAAETERVVENARAKLQAKNLDYVVANQVGQAGAGFGSETNTVTLLHRSGKAEEWPRLTKAQVAHRLLDRVAACHFAGPEQESASEAGAE